jgi:hypothetical protein
MITTVSGNDRQAPPLIIAHVFTSDLVLFDIKSPLIFKIIWNILNQPLTMEVASYGTGRLLTGLGDFNPEGVTEESSTC